MRKLLHFSLLAAMLLLCVAAPVTSDLVSTASAQLDPAPAIQGYETSPCGLSLVWQADGDSAGDFFGFSVDGGRDFNGDGYLDAVVGAMLADRAYAYYRNWLTGEFTRGFTRGGNSGSDFGRSVRFLGVPGNYIDGECNVLVGAPGHSGAGYDSCGVVADWDGSLDFSWIGTAVGEKLGYSVADAGDVDNDGYNDIIAGAPEAMAVTGAPYAGYALLLSPMAPVGSNVLHRFERLAPNEYFGRAVSGAGDVDGDQVPDVIIGAPLASVIGTPVANVGSAFVYRADGSLIWRFNGENSGDYFGNSVANAGDVNNDGRPDIIVGAWRADPDGMTDAGAAYVYSGLDGSLIYRLTGWAPNTNFGYSVRGLGDIDADGYDDFIVGAHRDDSDSKTDAGAVYVFSGRLGIYLWMIVGAMPDDMFGVSVAPMGDFTLDGRPDFLVGAFSTNPGGRIEAGSVYLFGCACDCTYNGDPAHDGVTDVLDVVNTVSDAFRNDPTEKSSDCRYCDSDVDCTGACDVLDVVKMVNVAFRNGNKATEFCSPCQ